MNRNYQKELDSIIADIAKSGIKKKLLLHVCCAPCSSYCLTYLANYFDIVTDFYNPNIAPIEEFNKRADEFKRFVSAISREDSGVFSGNTDISVYISEYEPEKFYEIAKGLETVKEGGERCFKCYRLRMEHAAKMAVKTGADYFTTTLSISPLKNAAKINEIGEELAAIYGVPHLPSDFKKREGYKRSIELSSEYDLYRQNYCGCVYSRRES